MWDGFNKRKFPRLNFQCEIEISSPEHKMPVVKTVTENVGIGGVCVIMDRPLNRFSECRVRLELDAPERVLECHGKVVWAVPTRSLQSRQFRYDIGIEFTDIETADRELLRTYLETRSLD